MEAYVYLIYHSVSLFQNTELHAGYEVQNPTDIVIKLLDIEERFVLGDHIFKMAGTKNVAEDVKN
ncbi:hypothetical protein D3C78_1869930 [compost metagenome]